MSERQLTTREIDDILTVFKGRRRTDQPADVASLDLNRPTPIPKGIFETLEVRHEQAARAMRNALRETLRRDLMVKFKSLELDRFAAFKEELPEPSCSFVVEMLPLRQPGYLVLDYPLVFAVLDRVLGGTGATEGTPRELTTTESAVLSDVLGSIIAEQAAVWSRWVKLAPRVLRSTSVPRFFREARADDPVLIASYSLGGFAEGTTFRFALPLPGLEPHLQCAPRSEITETARSAPVSKDLLLRAIADVQLELSVRLGGAELNVADVMELAIGDVLVLDTRTDQPLQLLVQDLPRFEGQLFRRGQRLAFQLGVPEPACPAAEGPNP